MTTAVGAVATPTKPKTKRVRATHRQKKAIAILAEKGGSVGAAMREAGYSDVSANTPAKLTDSQGYQALIEQYLPDQLLLEKHSEIINSPRIKRTFMKGAMIEETEETDPSQVRGLDMAYKLKGKYQSEGNTTNVLIVQLSDTAASRYKAIDPIHEPVHITQA